MAPPPGTLRVGRYFAALIALLALLYLVVFFPGNRHSPKLGIDLVGGVRAVYTAQVPKGSPAPTSSQMSQARQILEDRINTTGVTGATVVVQGTNQLVVEIPSATDADLARLGKAAVLNFRGLIAPEVAVGCLAPGSKAASASSSATPSGSASPSGSSSAGTPKASGTPSSSHSGADAAHRPLTAPTSPATTPKASSTASKAGATPTGSATPLTSGSAAASGSSSSAPPPKCTANPFAAVVKQYPALKPVLEPDATKGQAGLNAESCPSPAMPAMQGTKKAAPCTAWNKLDSKYQTAISAALATYDCASAQDEPDVLTHYYLACDSTGSVVYLLGHVVVRGADIDSAAAQAPSSNGQGNSVDWTVNLNLSGAGGNKWHAWTSAYNSAKFGIQNSTSASPQQCSIASNQPCSLYVGFTLDGAVLSLPISEAVLDTRTTVSGSFTESTSKALAQELNYGKLPITFHLETSRAVSATLGTSQLHGAFIAGGIGLILVVIYSLMYYRGLGLVTIASLLVSAGLTYAMLVILSSQISFTLDLAGIAGFIVALGITADSFVVFFERIKDEVHEGRSVRVAVPRAWVRARRTILSADTVSFLAAAILYFFASADVRGFAFTLGMSTILDLVVVFLFTHPIVSLLSRSRAFGSPRFTGLSNVRAGGIARNEDEPAERPARPRRAPARRTPAGTVLLEKEEAPATEELDDGSPAEPDAAEPDLPAAPRRRTTPSGGSAAERAAARRARLREQREPGEGNE